MQPLLRSSTTSLTTPTSSPFEALTFVPMILLVCTYEVLLELVAVWVWANRGAAAIPRMASAAPNRRDVFIVVGLTSDCRRSFSIYELISGSDFDLDDLTSRGRAEMNVIIAGLLQSVGGLIRMPGLGFEFAE